MNKNTLEHFQKARDSLQFAVEDIREAYTSADDELWEVVLFELLEKLSTVSKHVANLTRIAEESESTEEGKR